MELMGYNAHTVSQGASFCGVFTRGVVSRGASFCGVSARGVVSRVAGAPGFYPMKGMSWCEIEGLQ